MARTKGMAESTIAKRKELMEAYSVVLRRHGDLAKHIDKKQLYWEVSQEMNGRYSEKSVGMIICEILGNGRKN
jgi:hypothetical protein